MSTTQENLVTRYTVKPNRKPKTRSEYIQFGVCLSDNKEKAIELCQKSYKAREYKITEYLCEKIGGVDGMVRIIQILNQSIIKPKDELKQAVKEFNRLKDQGNDLEDIFEIAMNK